jgi:exopolysaccharide production protein ExoQ
MGTIALLLCTAFVLCLLAVEMRASRALSFTVWVPTLWMMIAASRPVATWFYGTLEIGQHADISNETGSAATQFTLTALGVIGIAILVRRRFNWSGLLQYQKWLLVVLAYMFISTWWSDITLIAMKRWIRELIALVMAVLLVSEPNPIRALASVFRRSAYALLPFSVVLIKYYPRLGRQYSRWAGVEMWTGVARQKNELGRLCMVSVFFLLFALYTRWRQRPRREARHQAWADFLVILVGFYLLVGSHSATSLATLLMGIAVFFALRWLKRFRLRTPRLGLQAVVLLLLAYGISLPFLGGSSAAAFTSLLGRDSTLTGRTEVWAAVLPEMQRHLAIGHGFGSFWTDARRELYEIPTAHNGYLDILLELGAVGLTVFIFWQLSCARLLHRALKQDYDWASFAICLLLMGLIYNATESALNSMTEYITAVVLFTTVAVPTWLGSKSARPVRMTMETPVLQLQGSLNLGYSNDGPTKI